MLGILSHPVPCQRARDTLSSVAAKFSDFSDRGKSYLSDNSELMQTGEKKLRNAAAAAPNFS